MPIEPKDVPSPLELARQWLFREGEFSEETGAPLIWPFENPPAYSTKYGPKEGSLFAPRRVLDPTAFMGVIKQSKGIATNLRKLMQQEIKARGPAIGDDIESQILRGTFYHSRRTQPGGRETKALAKEVPQTYQKSLSDIVREVFSYGEKPPTSSNLGEPTGISLTAQPKLFRSGSFGSTLKADTGKTKLVNKWSKYLSLPSMGQKEEKRVTATRHGINKLDLMPDRANFARVLPMYGGRPEDNILVAYQDTQTLKDAYVKTAKSLLGQRDQKFRQSGTSLLEQFNVSSPPLDKWTLESLEKYENSLDFAEDSVIKELISFGTKRKEFNRLLTEELKSAGFKGILYSPRRFDEAELKMFDPRDVLKLDERWLDDPAIERSVHNLGSKGKQVEEWYRLTGDEPESLRDVYSKIPPGRILDALR